MITVQNGHVHGQNEGEIRADLGKSGMDAAQGPPAFIHISYDLRLVDVFDLLKVVRLIGNHDDLREDRQHEFQVFGQEIFIVQTEQLFVKAHAEASAPGENDG